MRAEIVYDSQQYSLGNRGAASVREEIEEALRSGVPYWLEVQRGEGDYTPAYLLIVPGIAFAVIESSAGVTAPPPSED
jgi:hypothetical protein